MGEGRGFCLNLLTLCSIRVRQTTFEHAACPQFFSTSILLLSQVMRSDFYTSHDLNVSRRVSTALECPLLHVPVFEGIETIHATMECLLAYSVQCILINLLLTAPDLN